MLYQKIVKDPHGQGGDRIKHNCAVTADGPGVGVVRRHGLCHAGLG